MYFPGDPLLAHDPIFNCTADEGARQRLVSAFDWDTTTPGHALGYRFDIVLAGRDETPRAAGSPHAAGSPLLATTSQTVGPFFSIGMGWMNAPTSRRPASRGTRAVEGRVLDGDGRRCRTRCSSCGRPTRRPYPIPRHQHRRGRLSRATDASPPTRTGRSVPHGPPGRVPARTGGRRRRTLWWRSSPAAYAAPGHAPVLPGRAGQRVRPRPEPASSQRGAARSCAAERHGRHRCSGTSSCRGRARPSSSTV